MGRRLGAREAWILLVAGCGPATMSHTAGSAGRPGESDRCWLAHPPMVAVESLAIALHDRALDGPGTARLDDGSRVLGAETGSPESALDCAGRPLPGFTILRHGDSIGTTARLAARADGAIAPSLRIVVLDAGADPRDALDRGADVLVTAERAAARYAEARGDLLVFPLDPRWTYGLATRAREPLDQLAEFRRSLAFEIVPAFARPAEDSFGAGAGTCGNADEIAAAARPGAPRIVYREDDPIARAIAERSVSRAAAGDAAVRALLGAGHGGLTAVALDRTSFERALTAGSDAAYVVAWPSSLRDPCAALEAALPDADGPSRSLVLSPLIDAGGWIIVRRGSAGLVRDASGAPRLVLAPDGASGSR